MIRVVSAGPREAKVDAILRSVSSDCEPDTPFSRQVEIALGPEVSGRIQAMGDLPLGAAVITPGGGLGVNFTIHVVLQSPEQAPAPDILRLALRNGLRRAEEWGIETLALPPLGTGAGKMDAQDSAAVMLPIIREFLLTAESLREVSILAGSPYETDVFSGLIDSMDRVFPPETPELPAP
jgi:serine/threonine-protein kinase